MKYIIDVPDDYLVKSALNGLTLGIPMLVSSTQKEFIIPTNLRLDLYTEPDRKAIEDEVWEFARRIICPSDCCEDSISKYTEEFLGIPSHKARAIFKDLSYQEAKAKYEAWLKQKDEIRVGDEIYSDGDFEISIVMETYGDGSVSVYTKSGCIEHWYNEVHNLKKTGKHFDEIEELLKKMRDADED